MLSTNTYVEPSRSLTIVNFIVATLPAAEVRHGAFFGQGTGRIFLDDVTCNGFESQLIDCAHRPLGQHNCRHSDDAGVVCLGRHNMQINTLLHLPFYFSMLILVWKLS